MSLMYLRLNLSVSFVLPTSHLGLIGCMIHDQDCIELLKLHVIIEHNNLNGSSFALSATITASLKIDLL